MSLKPNVSICVSHGSFDENSNGSGDSTESDQECPLEKDSSSSSADVCDQAPLQEHHHPQQSEENQPRRKNPRFRETLLCDELVQEQLTMPNPNLPPNTNALAPASAANDECPAELRSLRYKIMLMNGNTPPVAVSATPAKNSYENLQLFLEKEKNNNNKENWTKLNKSIKNKKISEFVDTFATEHELTPEEHTRLLEMLKHNMSKGKLTKNKEVTYDKTKGIIKEMPCLVFNKVTRHFTIKNMDAATKHSGTIKKASGGSQGGGGGGGGSTAGSLKTNVTVPPVSTPTPSTASSSFSLLPEP